MNQANRPAPAPAGAGLSLTVPILNAGHAFADALAEILAAVEGDPVLLARVADLAAPAMECLGALCQALRLELETEGCTFDSSSYH